MAASYVKSFVLTLNGSAQQLSDVLAGTPWASEPEPFIHFLSLQPNTANAAIIKLGNDSAVDTTYSNRMEAPVATIPPAPLQFENIAPGRARLSDFWVKGTNAEVLRFMAFFYI